MKKADDTTTLLTLTADEYKDAGKRENTTKTYQAAVNHFEAWGGYLPATPRSIEDYLAAHAFQAPATLQLRLAALSKWHVANGFQDPTKGDDIGAVLRGIRRIHPHRVEKAIPLSLSHLAQTDRYLATQRALAREQRRNVDALRYARDRAMLLVGFWRGFRGDELSRLKVENVRAVAGQGMKIYLDQSKTDRLGVGADYHTPALSMLCPVDAYLDWITDSGLTSGPVFPAINQWGQFSTEPIKAGSVIPILRKVFEEAGIPNAAEYTAHSLRRGFATWANANGWQMADIMNYVGWKKAESAVGYVDLAGAFDRSGITRVLPLFTGIKTVVMD